MNAKLTMAISDNEIEKALFQMGTTKAPWPDRLPALFYRRHRSLVRDDVYTNVRDDTVTLKVNSPELLSQFRPISLCNCGEGVG